MTGQQDKPPLATSEKFLKLKGLGGIDPSRVNWDAVGGEIERLEAPRVAEKIFLDLEGSLVWDPTCGLAEPVGFSPDDHVDIVLASGWVGLIIGLAIFGGVFTMMTLATRLCGIVVMLLPRSRLTGLSLLRLVLVIGLFTGMIGLLARLGRVGAFRISWTSSSVVGLVRI